VALLTVGHGAAAAEAFESLVVGAGIRLVVDVRRFPGSRRHPQFARDELARSLPKAGVEYRWEEPLGGRRSGVPDSPNVGLRNAAFRAYADYMATPEFRTALGRLLADTDHQPSAVMCAESLWWRCHRRLIADAATLLHGVEVRHVMPDGRQQEHRPTDGAVTGDGQLVYRPPQPTLL
jgi:uncharacterized protein (DUF488 family)